VELAVVIVAVLLLGLMLGLMLVPALNFNREKAWRIICLNNLKQIGTGYRLRAPGGGTQADRPPSQAPVSLGGWRDLLTNSNAGQYCLSNYAFMREELGESPAVVVCPADERRTARSFTNGFDNTHVSYFVGVDASDVFPQAILGGDRNLGPGLVPAADYGYSPANGKGNDVVISTNSPVCWSLKMHSYGNASGGGNILLGDGSGQQTSSLNFRVNWLPNAQTGTNGIRLVFP
jgi:hypothetical protein